MIRVTLQPEPATFQALVRTPGQAFIRQLRRAPNKKEWQSASFWKQALPGLKSAYRDICAYTACWLPDSASVDHFVPKSADLNLAYEWSNYRLASQKVNSKKGNLTVLDPFTVDDLWFTIDFASSRVKPSPTTSQMVQTRIQGTILTLGLNDDGWVKVRFTVLRSYSQGKCTFQFLEEFYPFVARELLRQGLKDTIIGMVP